MNSKFVIRNETDADIVAIYAVTYCCGVQGTGNRHHKKPEYGIFADDIKCRSGRDGGSEDEA